MGAMARRTKIVATVGPATWEHDVLVELIDAGTDVLRLNFSHSEPDRLRRTIEDIRSAAEKVGREVAILGDLPGPKLRVGELKGDLIELKTGEHTTLTSEDEPGDAERIPVSWPDLEERSEERRVGKECRSRWSPYH